MAKLGYEVTVFEALHEIGGVLKYGIPEFRLPNRIVDFEIDNLRHMGVRFMADTIVGKTFRVDELREAGYCGIFVGSGAGLPRFMGCPGENLVGIMSSNEYLTRVNLMHAAEPDADTPVIEGKRVAVIGGGNTAMDSVRTAKRLGAERAVIVYRRSEDEMPARAEEIKHAKEEGVEFLTLHNPIAYEGDERGQVRRMLLQVMELGELGGRAGGEPAGHHRGERGHHAIQHTHALCRGRHRAWRGHRNPRHGRRPPRRPRHARMAGEESPRGRVNS